MNSSKVSLFFTLSMILIFSHSLKPSSCQSLYEKICRDTKPENRGPCLTAMKSDPRIPSAKDYLEITKYILDMSIQKAKDGRNHFLNLMKTNPSEAIHQCATTHYNEAIKSFITARMYAAGKPITARNAARDAGNGPNHCADAIKAANINDRTIYYINKTVLLLSDISTVAASKQIW